VAAEALFPIVTMITIRDRWNGHTRQDENRRSQDIHPALSVSQRTSDFLTDRGFNTATADTQLPEG
jgi:arylamine N-acetyltransferase